MNLSVRDNYILVKLESIILTGKNNLISRERFREISHGLDMPNLDEVDEIYDILTERFDFTENEISVFLDHWTSQKVKKNDAKTNSVAKTDISNRLSDDIFAGWNDSEEDIENEITADDKRFNFQNDNSELIDLLNTIQTHRDNRRLISLYQGIDDEDKIEQKKLIETKLVEINKRLVWKEALKYSKYVSSVSLTKDDLYIFGNMGMLRALKKFDMDQKTTFSTYATYWIKQAIMRAIADEGTTIRIPVHFYEQLVRFNKIKKRLYMEKSSVSVEDIAEAMGTTIEKVNDYSEKANSIGGMISIDIPVGDDGDNSNTLGDIYQVESVFDNEQFDMIMYEMKREDRETLYKQLINELSPREMRVLNLRFGLDDGRSRTLEEVGKTMGVTRERVRQIQRKALTRLRNIANHNKDKYPYNYELEKVGK